MLQPWWRKRKHTVKTHFYQVLLSAIYQRSVDANGHKQWRKFKNGTSACDCWARVYCRSPVCLHPKCKPFCGRHNSQWVGVVYKVVKWIVSLDTRSWKTGKTKAEGRKERNSKTRKAAFTIYYMTGDLRRVTASYLRPRQIYCHCTLRTSSEFNWLNPVELKLLAEFAVVHTKIHCHKSCSSDK